MKHLSNICEGIFADDIDIGVVAYQKYINELFMEANGFVDGIEVKVERTKKNVKLILTKDDKPFSIPRAIMPVPDKSIEEFMGPINKFDMSWATLLGSTDVLGPDVFGKHVKCFGNLSASTFWKINDVDLTFNKSTIIKSNSILNSTIRTSKGYLMLSCNGINTYPTIKNTTLDSEGTIYIAANKTNFLQDLKLLEKVYIPKHSSLKIVNNLVTSLNWNILKQLVNASYSNFFETFETAYEVVQDFDMEEWLGFKVGSHVSRIFISNAEAKTQFVFYKLDHRNAENYINQDLRRESGSNSTSKYLNIVYDELFHNPAKRTRDGWALLINAGSSAGL